MIKIMHLITDLNTGGAERQMATLVGYLQERNHSCHVFTLLSNGSLRDHFVDLAVPVYSGGLKEGDLIRAPLKLIFAELKLIRIIRHLRPSVVHSFLPLVTFMGTLAGRMTKVPLIISSRRALGQHQERHILLRPFDILANRFLSPYIICVAQKPL